MTSYKEIDTSIKIETMEIKSFPVEESRTKIEVYFNNKLKRDCEMKINKEFLEHTLSYIEHFLDTMLFCNYEGIRFEDYRDEYKSFNLVLNPVDMSSFNAYYNTPQDEPHRASATLRWIKGPEAKRPSQSFINGTKKDIVKEIYNFIRRCNPEIKSEFVESLLDADLYDYYERIK